jgi:hypothetical protein
MGSKESAKSISGQVGQQSAIMARGQHAFLKNLEKDQTFNSDPNTDKVEEKAKHPTSHHLPLIAPVEKNSGQTPGVLMSLLQFQWNGTASTTPNQRTLRR